MRISRSTGELGGPPVLVAPFCNLSRVGRVVIPPLLCYSDEVEFLPETGGPVPCSFGLPRSKPKTYD